MFDGRWVRMACTICIAGFFGFSGISIIYGEGDFIFEGDCIFENWAPVCSGITADLVLESVYPDKNITDVSDHVIWPISPDPIVQEGKKTWSTGEFITSRTRETPFHQVSLNARISVEWIGNILTRNSFTHITTKGSRNSSGSPDGNAAAFISNLIEAESTLRIGSTSLSQGTPAYLRLFKNRPDIYRYHETGFSDIISENWGCPFGSIIGPMGTNIWRDDLPQPLDMEDEYISPYILFQVGDTLDFLHTVSQHLNTNSVFSTSEIEIGTTDSFQVDVRKATDTEWNDNVYTNKVLYKEIPPQEFVGFGGNSTQRCAHAAIAMMLDQWANKYPVLDQPDQTTYYSIIDKYLDYLGYDPESGLRDDIIVKIMNHYFTNTNNYRNGGAVSLVAVGPIATSPKRLIQSKYPLILILHRYKSSSFMKRQDDNLFQNNKLNDFSGGYRYGRQDDYEDQTGIEPIFETV